MVWSCPEYTEKQKDYMVQETEIKRQEFEKSFSVEPEDIHQKSMKLLLLAEYNSTSQSSQDLKTSKKMVGNQETGFGQYR